MQLDSKEEGHERRLARPWGSGGLGGQARPPSTRGPPESFTEIDGILQTLREVAQCRAQRSLQQGEHRGK